MKPNRVRDLIAFIALYTAFLLKYMILNKVSVEYTGYSPFVSLSCSGIFVYALYF
jgi:hypothetical protein